MNDCHKFYILKANINNLDAPVKRNAFLTAILIFLNVHYVEMNKEDKMEFNKRGV